MLAGVYQESFGEPQGAGRGVAGACKESLGEPRSAGRGVAGAYQESLGEPRNAGRVWQERVKRAPVSFGMLAVV